MLETGQRGYLELPFDPVGGEVRARCFPLTPVDVFKNLWRRLKLLQQEPCVVSCLCRVQGIGYLKPCYCKVID